MKEFLAFDIWGNTVSDYLWVIGTILFVLLLKRIISKYIAIFLCRIFKRAWGNFDQDKFIDLIIHPLGIFLVITVSIIALYRLSFPQEINFSLYKYTLQQVLLSLMTIVQIVTFIWLLLRTIDFIATVLEARANRSHDLSDNQLVVFFRDFLKVVVGIIGVMMILHFAFGYHIGNLLTGLSIVGAAIALALRESLENLIASFVIFFDKPFTTGDFVRVQNISGNVERIGLRSTRVRTADKSYVTVPNKQMVDSILDNVSLRSQIRGEVNLFLHLQTPPGKIEQLLEAARKHLGSVPEVQSYNVVFNDIRMQSFVVFVEFFTPNMDVNLFTSIRQKLNFFLLQTMDEMGIRIAAEGKEAIAVNSQ
jgi:MscS family membrane protein